MATSARVCVVSNCPAMAVAGTDTCQVHAQGRRFGLGRPAARCRKCQHMTKPTDWITNQTFDDGSVEHVRCRPARVEAEEASQP